MVGKCFSLFFFFYSKVIVVFTLKIISFSDFICFILLVYHLEIMFQKYIFIYIYKYTQKIINLKKCSRYLIKTYNV